MTNNALEKVIPQCLRAALRSKKKCLDSCFSLSSFFSLLSDIVVEVLEKSRSSASPFPLRKDDLFHFLPPSNASMNSTNIRASTSMFISSSNSSRIDLTPGVIGSLSSRHPLKSIHQKNSFEQKRRTSSSSPLRNDYRREMSEQLAKFIEKSART